MVRRVEGDHPYIKLGFAAEGKICKPASSTATNCASTDPSVADGVYGYDSTTGNTTGDPTLTATYPNGPPTPNNLRGKSVLNSNLWQFYRRLPECSYTSCPDPNDTITYPAQPSNKITYPFPLVKPNPARLLQHAQDGVDQNGDPDGSKFYSCLNPAARGLLPSVYNWSARPTPLSRHGIREQSDLHRRKR